MNISMQFKGSNSISIFCKVRKDRVNFLISRWPRIFIFILWFEGLVAYFKFFEISGSNPIRYARDG